MSASGYNAVFLSYASADALAARALCAALRAAGIEVWFDEGVPAGGDQWESKVRWQIGSCALFVAVISANTEAHREGHFRFEWDLAAHCTLAIAKGTAFLLPIAIDDLRVSTALVPEEFKVVPWTRLPQGRPTPEFVAHVQRLLAPSPPVVANDSAADPNARRPATRRSPAPWIVAGLAVALGAFFFFRPAAKPAAAVPPPAPVAGDKSVAVLPFANLSPDRDNELFADGIQEELLRNLQNIRQLRVVSLHSVLPYRATTISVRQIAQELGVTYVVEGSARRAGDKIRVRAALINARTDSQIWSLPPAEHDLTDIFSIQSSLATAIARALAIELSPQERQLVESNRTVNLTAYDLYHRALDAVDRIGVNVDAFSRAEPLLQNAAYIDPKFAGAWGQLALFLLRHDAQRRDATGVRFKQAQQAIDTMEQLAPDQPESLLLLAAYYSRRLEYPRSDDYLQRAIAAQPLNGEVVMQLGDMEQRKGDFAAALAQYRRAYALDRQSPEIRRALRSWLIRLRRYDEALQVERDDPQADGYFAARLAFLARGSKSEMERWLPRHLNSERQDDLTWYWDSGAAEDFVRRCEETRRDGGLTLANTDETKMAFALMTLGETARARAEATNQIALVKAAGVTTSRLYAINLALLGEKAAALQVMESYLAAAREKGQDLDLTHEPAGKAVVLAWAGEKDRAFAELARLLKTPSGLNVYEMRSCVYWQPLRDDPRFAALLNDPLNNAPLF